MSVNPMPPSGSSLNQLAGTRAPGAEGKPPGGAVPEDFATEFEKVKMTVIKPALETLGNSLKALGHGISVAEDVGGSVSIHIVPAGVSKSIHPYDWFPTLIFFGIPATKTIGLQGRNARRNSEASTASRGDYKPSQISREVVEKELKKFVGEIANW